MPFSFLDEEGEVNGIIEDYWGLIRDKLQVKEQTGPTLPFVDILKRIEGDKLDLHVGTTRTPDREAYARFTNGFERYPIAIAARRNTNFITKAKDLEGETVAVGREYSAYHLLKARYPDINFLQVENTRAALAAVKAGQAFAAVDILPVLQYQMESYVSEEVRLVGVTDVEFELQMMVRDELAPLVPLLNRAIAAISPEERLAIHRRWMLRDVVKKNDYGLLLWVIAVALLVLGLMFYWNRRLAIAHRQAAEERAKAQRYLDTVQTLMVGLDRQGRITMINPAGCALLGYSQQELLGRNWFEHCLPQPEGTGDVYPVFRQLMAGGIKDQEYFENPVLCRDGSQRILAWRNAYLRDKYDNITGILSSGEDITQRHEFEASLQQALARQRAAEQFSRATVDALSAHLCVLDENGVVIMVNQAWRDFADANPPPPPDYGMGANYIDICRHGGARPDAAPRPDLARRMAEILNGNRQRFTFEYPCHAPGEERWFIAHISRFLVDGKVRVVVAHENITDRKITELELQRFSRNFETLLEQTSDFIYFKDENSRFVFCSQALARITGHADWREMIGKHDRDVFPADTASIYEEEERPIFEQGTSLFNLVEPYYDTEGRPGYVMSSKWPLKDPSGQVVGLAGISRDVTEAQNTQKALRTSEQKLRGLFELSPLGIARNDLDTAFLECNHAFSVLTGYSPAELKQLDFWRLAPEAYHPVARKELERLAEQGRYGPFETEFLQKSGGSVMVSLTGILLHGKDGEESIWSIAENITERKRDEETLIAAREAAEAANQAKSAFLANMSHELRTPLNAILGFSQVLLNSPQLPRALHPEMERIRRGGDYLLTLINDILDLSKIEAGRIELFPEEFDLPRFLQEVTEMVRLRAEQKGVSLEYRPAPALPDLVRTDLKRLRQVLLNLLGNAVKFTEQGHVRLSAAYSEGKIHFVVEDTGPGIPADDQQRIFQPFAQSGDQHSKIQGTGLGLSISSRIVALMGGELAVESEPGRGSRFHFEIPLEAVFDAPAAAKKGGAQADSDSTERRPVIGYSRSGDQADEPLRLLIVDDVEDNSRLLCHALRPLGFELAEADSGEACLELVGDFRPDLVLMDVRMPGLDGLQTMEALHRQSEFAELPVILVTAQVFREDREEALARGGAAYLAKPVDLAALLQAIGELLPLEWQYPQDAATKPQAQDPPNTRFPADWLEALGGAVELGSTKQLRRLLDQREEQGEYLPPELREWLEGYEYDQIIRWIELQKTRA
jgi:PAS domain S-box-containing protein